MVETIKSSFPQVCLINYFTDGCAGQYKNFKNFINCFYYKNDHGILAKLHFFGSGQGKNSCDAIAGTVKRLARTDCLKCKVIINNSEEFYDWATTDKTAPKKIGFFHITKDDIAKIVEVSVRN